MTRRLPFALLLVVLISRAADAQTGASPAGPLVLEPIETRLVIAPEYKVTDVDGRTAQLAGVSVGALTDEAMYLGGAIYSLANRADDFRLTYGGLLVGWTVPAGSRIRVGGRSLFGLGSATIGDSITVRDRRTLAVRTVQWRQRDDFIVAEPQAQAHVSAGDHVGVDVTAGYRFTGMEGTLRDRLDGATGSLALQFAW